MSWMRRIAALFGGKQHDATAAVASPASARVLRLLQDRPDLRAFVRENGQRRWRPIRATRDGLVLDDGQKTVIRSSQPYVVAYPSGEILECAGRIDPLPEGVFSIEPAAVPVTHELRLEDLAEGNRHVAVTFGPSPSRPKERRYYATKLTNIGTEPLCVRRFAAYRRDGDRYQLSTITGSFFTGDQFAEWYGAPADGWIMPGASVCDPSNYGGDGLWAYFIELRSGRQLVAGSVVE